MEPDNTKENSPKNTGPGSHFVSQAEVVLVPLGDLIDPPWNPRPLIEEGPLRELMDFMARGGYTPPIWVWTGEGKAPWNVISGKRRCEAARRLGKTHIEAIFMDITLEEAKYRAFTSNKDNKPYWLGEYVAIEGMKNGNNESYSEIADSIGWSKTRVARAISLTNILNDASRQLILRHFSGAVSTWNDDDQTAEKTGQTIPKTREADPKVPKKPDKPWILVETVALGLLPFKTGRPVMEAQMMVQRALPILLSRELSGPQTDELVDWVISGKELAEFEPSLKSRKKRAPAGRRKVGVGGPGTDMPKMGNTLDGSPKEQVKPTPPNEPAVTLGNRLREAVAGGKELTLKEKLSLAYHGLRKGAQKLKETQGRFKTIPTGNPTDADRIGEPAEGADSPKEPEQPDGGQRLGAAVKGQLLNSPFPKKGIQAGFKMPGKAGKWAARIFWHWSLKQLHTLCKWLANQAVPRGHSSHKRHPHGGGLGPGSTNPVNAVLHWGVYSLCQLAFWFFALDSLASQFAPGLKPWVEFPFRYLAALAAVDFPAWVFRQAQEHLAWAIIAGILLAVGIGGAFAVRPVRTMVLLALLGAVWFYGRGWGTTTIEPPRASVQRPQAEGQALSAPIPGDKGIGAPSTTQTSEAPMPKEKSIAGQTFPALKKTTSETSHVPPVPEELKDRMEDDADYTAEFAGRFFGTHYDKHGDWHNWFEYRVRDDYYDAFFKEFDIPSRWQEINDKQLTLAFEPSGKARLIRWDDTSDDFRVEGVLTTRSDLVYPRKFISRGRAALAVSFAHKPDGSVTVYEVREIKPAQ